MLREIFKEALESKHNSPLLIITFNTIGAAGGAALSSNNPVAVIAAGVTGGILGLAAGRLADGYVEWRSQGDRSLKHL